MESIAKAFQDGGFFMYVILIASIFAFGITIERIIIIFFRSKLKAEALLDSVARNIRVDRINNAIDICEEYQNPLSRVIKSGLWAFQQHQENAKVAMEEATIAEIQRLEERTPFLSMIAQIATLLGLLGTILGLMQAFNAVGTASAAERTFELTKGISKAMNTTAFGLMVAIPSLVCYTIIARKTEKIIDNIDRYAMKVANLLPKDEGK